MQRERRQAADDRTKDQQGTARLHENDLNEFTAFTWSERMEFGLVRLLPTAIETLAFKSSVAGCNSPGNPTYWNSTSISTNWRTKISHTSSSCFPQTRNDFFPPSTIRWSAQSARSSAPLSPSQRHLSLHRAARQSQESTLALAGQGCASLEQSGPRSGASTYLVVFLARKTLTILLILLVPGGGLEPPRPCGLRILSPLRLPISPSGRQKNSCQGSGFHQYAALLPKFNSILTAKAR